MEGQVQAAESSCALGPWDCTERNLCPAYALAMRDADPTFYNTMWNEIRTCRANVKDKFMDPDIEISKEALGI